jgi:hypothetical protein
MAKKHISYHFVPNHFFPINMISFPPFRACLIFTGVIIQILNEEEILYHVVFVFLLFALAVNQNLFLGTVM